MKMVAVEKNVVVEACLAQGCGVLEVRPATAACCCPVFSAFAADNLIFG